MEKPTKSAGELLGARRAVYLVRPDDTVLSAIEALAEREVGALVVCDGERMVGIVSERDYARKVERLGRTAKDTKVRDIMTADVLYVAPKDTVDHCMKLMKQNRVRHLPVIENSRIVGVLSLRDVLQEVITEEEHLIRDLEQERLVMTTNTGTY
jgi:CBS domain-containing protein